MIKAEWKYILKHKLMVIVFIVMIFIPSIYSVTFLKSMWDPYGELQDLPVAVVNHDKGLNYQGTNLHVGQDLTKNLSKSKAMDFHVLDSNIAANKGLKNGKYYMVITIPKNFSKNATTLLNKKPQKMVLNYETSAGHNFTASKMTAQAAQKAAQEVSQQVTKTYSKTMFTAIKQVSKGMATAANGSRKLVSGSTKVADANQQITTGLTTLANSSLTFANGSKTLTLGLEQYMAGVNQASNGSQTLTNGLNQLNNKSATLVNGANQLSSGGNSLTTGLQNYTNGVSELNAATDTLSTGANNLGQGTSQLSTSATTLNSGLSKLQAASQDLTDNLQKVSSGLTSNSTQLNNSITNLKQQLANNDSNQAQAIKTDLNSLQKELDSASLTSKVAQVADQQGLTASQKAAILAAVSSPNTELTQSLDTLNTDLNILLTKQTTAANQLDTLQSSLSNSQNNLSTEISQLTNGSTQLTNQLGVATVGMNQLNTGIGEVNLNTSKLAHSTSQLHSGTNQLANNGSALNTGAKALSSGINAMNIQIPSLTSGISQLDNGANNLNSGLTQLRTNGLKLSNGANTLTSGASQLASGSQNLATGSTQLGSGINQITSGNQTLAKQLAAGAKKSHLRPTNLTYNQLAQPVTTNHKERDKAPNNGTGMAPYMLSVSLFVGALAFNLMFDIYTPRKFPRTGIAWWASKATTTGTFALGESLAVFILLNLIDGLKPVQTFPTFIVLFLTSLMFMSIICWLNLVLGKVGSFLSMILLVFQLGGSAGTYPIQLSNHFFNAIHPYLPMSYSVSALRQTLMIGDSANPDIFTILAITISFAVLTIIFFIIRKSRFNEIDFTKEAAEHSEV
ncbi:YhgE/Pip domain-containing protein [Companilactobacillus zhachilii]|uniref:YhgE/Pip domain-containing protein n=1 Tax=Companilactobacillus zhachilii TaxID=2304606 RepID=A0A386PWG0_9LACO|nr:YhgE/Pip domain-containing protein [Companilactobacillus zhachilii]AYE38837.1 YhgE/Pip domain-containing protein [Companilactobacillus zhachilii]